MVKKCFFSILLLFYISGADTKIYICWNPLDPHLGGHSRYIQCVLSDFSLLSIFIVGEGKSLTGQAV